MIDQGTDTFRELSQRDRVALRLSARVLNLLLLVMIVGIAAGVFFGEKVLEREWLIDAAALILPGFFVLMLIEAVVHGLFGTTPGHTLMKVSLRTREGQPLKLAQQLRRNLFIWLRVMACFIPPFCFFTFIRYYRTLLRGEVSAHDTVHGYRTEVRKSAGAVVGSLLIAVFSMIIIGVVLAIFRRIIHG